MVRWIDRSVGRDCEDDEAQVGEGDGGRREGRETGRDQQAGYS